MDLPMGYDSFIVAIDSPIVLAILKTMELFLYV
jgi:hypothetical protein